MAIAAAALNCMLFPISDISCNTLIVFMTNDTVIITSVRRHNDTPSIRHLEMM